MNFFHISDEHAFFVLLANIKKPAGKGFSKKRAMSIAEEFNRIVSFETFTKTSLERIRAVPQKALTAINPELGKV